MLAPIILKVCQLPPKQRDSVNHHHIGKRCKVYIPYALDLEHTQNIQYNRHLLKHYSRPALNLSNRKDIISYSTKQFGSKFKIGLTEGL